MAAPVGPEPTTAHWRIFDVIEKDEGRKWKEELKGRG